MINLIGFANIFFIKTDVLKTFYDQICMFSKHFMIISGCFANILWSNLDVLKTFYDQILMFCTYFMIKSGSFAKFHEQI